MTEIIIRVDDRGQLSMSAPLDNPMLCYGLLEMARDMVKDHQDKKKSSAVIPASGQEIRALSFHKDASHG